MLNLETKDGNIITKGGRRSVSWPDVISFLRAEDSVGAILQAESEVFISSDVMDPFKRGMALHAHVFLLFRGVIHLLSKEEAPEYVNPRLHAAGRDLIIRCENWPPELVSRCSPEGTKLPRDDRPVF